MDLRVNAVKGVGFQPILQIVLMYILAGRDGTRRSKTHLQQNVSRQQNVSAPPNLGGCAGPQALHHGKAFIEYLPVVSSTVEESLDYALSSGNLHRPARLFCLSTQQEGVFRAVQVSKTLTRTGAPACKRLLELCGRLGGGAVHQEFAGAGGPLMSVETHLVLAHGP
eukprot:6464699-Amphidinium_carterae.1